MSLSINPYNTVPGTTDPSASEIPKSGSVTVGAIVCPNCEGDFVPTGAGSDRCPYCDKRLEIRVWPVVRQNSKAATALSDQATCFFHPDKVFQACCNRCGRFVCALCDLHLGAEHVCPTCFERGRGTASAESGKAEWRHRDVLYDSIALTAGWVWILFWPSIIVALPSTIFLHVKYRKAPRVYLIPRAGWRFWMAYVGLLWLPLLLAVPFLISWMVMRH